jgi:galactose mutarotase-like enzyme
MEAAESGALLNPEWGRRELKNGSLRVEVLPELGGKVSSITLLPSGGELLQGPLKPYAARTATQPFDEADGSGWDECLPSIGPCTVAYGRDTRSATIEDHGDFWRLPFTVLEATETSLRMQARGTSLPLEFTRGIRLEHAALVLDYSVTNTADVPVSFGWSVHPLFAIQPDDRIHLPASVKTVTAQASADGRLGAAGTQHAWPLTTNAVDGQPLDMARTGTIDDGVGDKLVLDAPAEGWCAIERKTLRTLVTMRFEPTLWKTLGLWICYGGWPEHGTGKKGYTVALEPCNLPNDSLLQSLAQGAGSHLEPGEVKQWTLRLEISSTEER